ncbi:hypothetical protein DENSPDRAFT_885799 [Dentipellis sp. KUC8613]|nr:hypothetical protein DENSPDRAFT_885799 [Dentipellis sp. KUC8613]
MRASRLSCPVAPRRTLSTPVSPFSRPGRPFACPTLPSSHDTASCRALVALCRAVLSQASAVPSSCPMGPSACSIPPSGRRATPFSCLLDPRHPLFTHRIAPRHAILLPAARPIDRTLRPSDSASCPCASTRACLRGPSRTLAPPLRTLTRPSGAISLSRALRRPRTLSRYRYGPLCGSCTPSPPSHAPSLQLCRCTAATHPCITVTTPPPFQRRHAAPARLYHSRVSARRSSAAMPRPRVPAAPSLAPPRPRRPLPCPRRPHPPPPPSVAVTGAHAAVTRPSGILRPARALVTPCTYRRRIAPTNGTPRPSRPLRPLPVIACCRRYRPLRPMCPAPPPPRAPVRLARPLTAVTCTPATLCAPAAFAHPHAAAPLPCHTRTWPFRVCTFARHPPSCPRRPLSSPSPSLSSPPPSVAVMGTHPAVTRPSSILRPPHTLVTPPRAPLMPPFALATPYGTATTLPCTSVEPPTAVPTPPHAPPTPSRTSPMPPPALVAPSDILPTPSAASQDAAAPTRLMPPRSHAAATSGFARPTTAVLCLVAPSGALRRHLRTWRAPSPVHAVSWPCSPHHVSAHRAPPPLAVCCQPAPSRVPTPSAHRLCRLCATLHPCGPSSSSRHSHIATVSACAAVTTRDGPPTGRQHDNLAHAGVHRPLARRHPSLAPALPPPNPIERRQFRPRAPPFCAHKPAFASRVTAVPAAPPRLTVVTSCHAIARHDALSTPDPALFAPRTTICAPCRCVATPRRLSCSTSCCTPPHRVAPHPTVSHPTPPCHAPRGLRAHSTVPRSVPRSARPVPPSAGHTGRLRVPWGRLAPHPFPPSHTPPRRICTPPCCFCANTLHGLSPPHAP